MVFGLIVFQQVSIQSVAIGKLSQDAPTEQSMGQFGLEAW